MSSSLDELHQIEHDSLKEARDAGNLDSLESIRVKFLGRKDGLLTKILQTLPNLSGDERKQVGRRANEIKRALEGALAGKRQNIEETELTESLTRNSLDLSLPGTPLNRGNLHPITKTMDEIVSVFSRLGFNLAEGPEIETDYNNFTALNHPPEHPARDEHDTFYLKDLKDKTGAPFLLRTHTSPVQIRYMQKHKPPLYVVAPGRVFRHEAVDATHSFVFHQVEGLAVDKGISLADLKGMLSLFAQQLFGSKATIRFRPSYFPFVEPGIEVDISCTICQQKGCCVCKQSGWIEMLGAGLVHPNVFRAVGYDTHDLTGYAFGIGVERVAMFKYGVDDMRLFYENDIRFLKQF